MDNQTPEALRLERASLLAKDILTQARADAATPASYRGLPTPRRRQGEAVAYQVGRILDVLEGRQP
jgi:hypothetical protein